MRVKYFEDRSARGHARAANRAVLRNSTGKPIPPMCTLQCTPCPETPFYLGCDSFCRTRVNGLHAADRRQHTAESLRRRGMPAAHSVSQAAPWTINPRP